MNTSDKVAIGCTLLIGTSALTMILLSNKYLKMADKVDEELQDIHHLVSKSREDIIKGNKAISEGNVILRGIARDAMKEAEMLSSGKIPYKKPSILNPVEGG